MQKPDNSQNYYFEAPIEEPRKTSVKDTLALTAFIISIIGLIIGFVAGPLGIGISALGFAFSAFVTGKKHFARYGLILGMVGIFTGIIVCIVQLVLAATPVILPVIKALGFIGTIFTYISNWFGWNI